MSLDMPPAEIAAFLRKAAKVARARGMVPRGEGGVRISADLAECIADVLERHEALVGDDTPAPYRPDPAGEDVRVLRVLP